MKHLLKFSKKSAAFFMVFCITALTLFSPCYASDKTTYRFSDINLEVQVPSELISFTQSVTSNNSYLELIGADDVEELRSLMQINHIYLEAVPKDVSYELIISGKEAGSASADFTSLSNEDLNSLFNEYLEKSDRIENDRVTEKVTASSIEYINGIPYFSTNVTSVANNMVTVYVKKYYTVMKGNSVSFFIQSNGKEIDTATDELLKDVVASAQYKTVRKSVFENSFVSEILASIITLAIPIMLLALVVYILEKSKKKSKKQIEADERRLRAEYSKQAENKAADNTNSDNL